MSRTCNKPLDLQSYQKDLQADQVNSVSPVSKTGTNTNQKLLRPFPGKKYSGNEIGVRSVNLCIATAAGAHEPLLGFAMGSRENLILAWAHACLQLCPSHTKPFSQNQSQCILRSVHFGMYPFILWSDKTNSVCSRFRQFLH